MITYKEAMKRGRPFNRYWKGAFRGQMTARQVWQWGEHTRANCKRIRIIVSSSLNSGFPYDGYPSVYAVEA